MSCEVQEFLLGIKNSMYEKYSRYALYFTQHLVISHPARLFSPLERRRKHDSAYHTSRN